MIRLVADENIQASLIRALREDGHDVLYVAENTGGITDNAVLAWAAEQERILFDRGQGLRGTGVSLKTEPARCDSFQATGCALAKSLPIRTEPARNPEAPLF